MELLEGDYAIGRFKLTTDDFEQTCGWMCGTWLFQSGYVPADGFSFEMYPEPHKDGVFTVDICIPVKPA